MPSTRLVALLRAVNVGGRGVLSMSDLRALTAGLGHRDVATYIQSGNLVFTTDRPATSIAARKRIGDELGAAIADQHQVRTTVMIRTVDELRDASRAMPFLADEPDSSKLMIVFLDDAPDAASIAALDPARFVPDRFAVLGREMFIHYPNGAGRSKLTASSFEKLGVAGTARNLNTVRKLIELAAP